MYLNISTENKGIKIMPADELEEIAQNVRMILTTLKKTVPMDRAFGIDGDIVDLPVAAAQARLTAEIVGAIALYEPRASVVSVDYTSTTEEGNDGILQAKVRIEINET